METNMITEHFSMEEMTHSSTLDEFNKKHGWDFKNYPLPDEVDNLKHLCTNLEVLRALMKCPLTISSGFRSPLVNRLVGGSKRSLHIHGLAADVILPHDKMLEFAVRAMNMEYTCEVYLSYKTNRNHCGCWVHIGMETEKLDRCRVGVDINGKVFACIHYKQL